MALLLPVLSCKVMERPETSWTPNSVMVITWMVVVPRSRPDSTLPACNLATRGSSTFMKYRTSLVTSTCQSEPRK
ncbi:hypothetical protein F7725_012806 [Dissostichus mawsoni]|uniref:Uncharacterized protein n=1 Tax=Dissostichus mawsoni TaxID=36200 RepID=A0A7J5YNB4_DISMA|nr:hypothetical protein F7725_012806 [Dissostichus mawsoni]